MHKMNRELFSGKNLSVKWYLLVSFFLCIGLFLTQSISCHAEVLYQNPEKGYEVLIEDDANLLTVEEIMTLAETMKPITQYGNVAFKSVSYNTQDTDDFAKKFYERTFGNHSGTVFVIDMDNRNIYIYSKGAVYRIITKSYANTITDNVYRYASKKEYFNCANEAFLQIVKLLEGGHILQPMKYISNALLAVILALLFNFTWICYFSRLKSPTSGEIMKSMKSHFTHTAPSAVMTHQTKVYDPPSSGGGSDSGGYSGGSSGSSGSSGGGGGHSF